MIYIGVFMVGEICNLIFPMIGTIFGRYDFAAASRFISPLARAIMVCAYFYDATRLQLTESITTGYIGLIVVCTVSFLLTYLIKPLDKHPIATATEE